MTFTEEDIPLMKLIFNPSTYYMGMMIGKERAKEIGEYIYKKVSQNRTVFIEKRTELFSSILIETEFCNFFWDNNILPLSFLEPNDITYVLRCSPIAEKIWESKKLNVSLLDEKDLEYFKRKFESL